MSTGVETVHTDHPRLGARARAGLAWRLRLEVRPDPQGRLHGTGAARALMLQELFELLHVRPSAMTARTAADPDAWCARRAEAVPAKPAVRRTPELMKNRVVSEPLFVYGTLAPGRPNEHVLEDVVGTWDEASVQGRLVQHGWGADLGYPALELSADGDWVVGLVFTSDALAEHWERLDEFEGDGYERVVTRAKL